MNTPQVEDFDTIIEEFNAALRQLGPELGTPVSRAERALLKTFFLFLLARAREASADQSADQPLEVQAAHRLSH
jgi:hypothetical protein